MTGNLNEFFKVLGLTEYPAGYMENFACDSPVKKKIARSNEVLARKTDG